MEKETYWKQCTQRINSEYLKNYAIFLTNFKYFNALWFKEKFTP